MSREEDLLKRIVSNDEAAFYEFHQRYSSRIYKYLFRILKNRADSEDVLQEVMMAVWENASACRNKAQPLGWLFGIARNQAYSRLNKPLPARSSDPDVQIPDPSQKIEKRLVAKDSLQKALPRLSAKHREVVELAYFEQLSCLEISQAVGCKAGTVRSRLHYALESLFQILRKDWKK